MRKIRWFAIGFSLTIALAASAKLPTSKIAMDKARQIALAKVPGTVVHDELEKEKGRWIYSIEVRPTGETGKRIKEVNIDASTGEIVETVTEKE